MSTWNELKKAELGQAFGRRQLTDCCKWIYGGFSCPNKRPGCAVIVAMDHAHPLGSHEMCLLAEFESVSPREVVRQCGVLDFKFMPKRWIGDWQSGAADRFIQEMNRNREKRDQRKFSPVEPFELLEMKPLYPFILDEIKRLRDPGHRQLFLPDDCKILSYLSEIQVGEIAELELGAYPAIEALAFAVIEMLESDRVSRAHADSDQDDDYDDDNPINYASRGDNPINYRG